MEPTKYIRVCDDNAKRAGGWARDIEEALASDKRATGTLLTPRALTVEEFAEAFENLKLRQRNARSGAVGDHSVVLDKIDAAEIVISDFDLTPMDGHTGLDADTLKTLSGSFGDVFAYLVRHFTDAAYVVLANQAFFQSTFDLTHMRFATSNADLNVAGDDLRQTGLWTGRSDGMSYRPWHWPRLLSVAEQRRDLARAVDLEAPVLETLGLADPATRAQFTQEQLEFLGPQPDLLRFGQVCEVAGRFGRSTPHEVIPEEHLPLATVAVVCHWLERIVLPGQNVLVDAPHLAQRRPGVTHSRDEADWASLSDLSDAERVRGCFVDRYVGEAELPRLTPWMTRPVWAWHRVSRSVPQVDAAAQMVFCEDVSAFHPIDDVWEYDSSVPSPFTQRFVLRDDVVTGGMPLEYWPTNRLFV